MRYETILILASGLAVINIENTKTTTSFLLWWLDIIFEDIVLNIIIIIDNLAKNFLFSIRKGFGITSSI